MKPFLVQLSEQLFEKYGHNFQDVTVVFPNRRAGLFFRKHLSKLLKKPVWAPQILNVDEFVKSLSGLQSADHLTLLFLLFDSYKKVSPVKDSFDQFYYWGEMLLRDFNEIDKYLINAEDLFKDLKNQKDLENQFAYLTEEQLKVIRQFWTSFDAKPSRHQEDFLQVWHILAKVYATFKQQLFENGIGYDGLIFREVAEKVKDGPIIDANRQIVFAGFNALTKAEEIIIGAILKGSGASMFWDLDQYYFNNIDQEAGNFLRKYAKSKSFADTFPAVIPDDFKTLAKKIEIIGVPLAVGQAKLLGQMLSSQTGLDGQEAPEKTAIVMPDEQMLFPVLHSLPAAFSNINITMGYPLRDTPLYGFIEHLLNLQQNIKENKAGRIAFYYKHVVSLLKHPYVNRYSSEEASDLIAEIKKTNKISVEVGELNIDSFYEKIFQKVNSAVEIFDYLLNIILVINGRLDQEGKAGSEVVMEKEYVFHFYTQLKRLKEIILQQQVEFTIQTFLKLFRQIIFSLKLPFSGEPLNGLQIMGVLETRNLDFDNVYMLSMNEGQFPLSSGQSSFIPYNLRKGYGLPTYEQQDAIYAYNFYRLIQRAKRVCLFYNTESGIQTGGEMSRFLYQLRYEAPVEVEEHILSNPIKVPLPVPIVIQKNQNVLDAMSIYLAGKSGNAQKSLTPSAFNTYLDCSLKFYFRYVVRMYESDAIDEEIDAAVFGNLLHHAMENFYNHILHKNGHRVIAKKDLQDEVFVEQAVLEAFSHHFGWKSKDDIQFDGRNLIVKEIVLKMVKEIVRNDQFYTPFEIIGLEDEKSEYKITVNINTKNGQEKVLVKGIIDRVDFKDSIIRVIDYKTGKDNKKFEGVAGLFDRNNPKRNKAAMQTLMYSLLYAESESFSDHIITPGLYNARELFSSNFSIYLNIREEGAKFYEPVRDARPFLASLKIEMGKLLEEIYEPSVPFAQTRNLRTCSYCPYVGICHR